MNATVEETRTAPVAESSEAESPRPLPLAIAALWALCAVVCFHAAYGLSSYWIFGYLLGLVQLARRAGESAGFYLGLGVGLLTVAPQLSCFWVSFGAGSIPLWCIVAFWVGLFVWLAHRAFARLGPWKGGLLVPFLWIGLEYFRSELYYLKFSWVNVGYAFAESAAQPLFKWTGMYGFAWLCVAAVVLVSALPMKRSIRMGLRLALVVILLLFGIEYVRLGRVPSGREVRLAGIQLEFPNEKQILDALNELKTRNADLLLMSEYTLDGPVPDSIRNWCRENGQYLVIGGKDPASNGDFYDTAFVVGPSGEIVFRQGKSVPIQFTKDGLPARGQEIWNSPWGKIGFCVCYDLSFSRVTDPLIRRGAQAILVPTMDIIAWGQWEHQLHARVGPVRAAEYGVPVVRLASSGISQIVDATGKVTARAGFPGQGEILSGSIFLGAPGSLPWDRWLGFGAACLAGVWLVLSALGVKLNLGGWFKR